MGDFWGELTGGQQSLPQGGNDPAAVTAYFTQKVGRPPTDAELAAYVNGTPNFQQEIDANVAAPNGYGNLVQFGNVNGTPASGTAFGAAPATYAPDAAASSILRQQYVAPQFTEAAPEFKGITVSDVANDPFVQYGEQRAIRAQQNSAAAKGTVLNAQTTAALGRDVQDYAGSQTNNVFGRANQTFQNALATYGAKYNVFTGNAAAADAADTKNKTAAQTTIGNTKDAYTTNFNANQTAQTDYWNRLMDLSRTGAASAAA
jgi:hypothetical protein